MALQITGEWDCQSPNTDAGSGLATCSYTGAFMASGPVTSAAGMHLFARGIISGFECQTFTPTTVKISVQLTTNQFSYLGTFSTGVPHFYCLVTTPGSQQLYLDGILVASNTFNQNVVTASTPLHFGVDATQTQPITMTINPSAIYEGTALTAQNAVDLLQGNVTELALGATHFYTFAGTNGATPKRDDVGLSNSGSKGAGTGNKYVLSSINPSNGSGTAVYASNLVYTPPINLPAYLTRNGMVALIATNPAGSATATISSIGTSPTFRVNGTPTTFTGPIWDDHDLDSPVFMYNPPTPLLSTDVVDFTLPIGSINTSLGGNGPVELPTTIPNYIGQLEPGFGGFPGFNNVTPSARLGLNVDGTPFVNYWAIGVSMNQRLRLGTPMTVVSGGNPVYDSVDPTLPVSMTPNGVYSMFYWNTQTANGIEGTGQVGYPSPIGRHSFVYEDVNALNANALVLWLVGNPLTCAGCDTAVSGPGLGSGSTYHRSVAANGTTVTITYDLSYVSNPNFSHGYNLGLFVYIKSPVGMWAQNNTITNFWIFAPGDSSLTVNDGGNDRSNPFALSNYVANALTVGNGVGPANLRWMEACAAFGGVCNIQTAADLTAANLFTYGLQAATNIPIAAVRFYNLNPSSGTYAWSSPKLYHPYLGVSGTDAVGNYLDIGDNIAAGGQNDNGQVLDAIGAGASPDIWAVMEFRTTSPHNLRSGDQVVFPNLPTSANAVPVTGGAGGTLTGSCTVTNGSTTLTVSSQTIAANTCVTFSSDSTGQAYRILAGGTGTTFTLFPAYSGTNSSSATATKVAASSFNNLKGACWVTSATTFAMACANNFGIASGTTIQTMTGTSEVALSFNINPAQNGRASYAFAAAASAQWENCICHIPIPPLANDGCLQAMAAQMAPYLRPGQIVRAERGLEHWNNQFPTIFYEGVYANLIKYLPASTTLNSYYITAPSGQAALTRDQVYVLQSAHDHDVLQAAFDLAGKNIQVDRTFGSWFTSPQTTVNMVSFGSGSLGTPSTGGLQKKVPMSSISIASYIDSPAANTTWKNFCSSSSGNAPVAKIHDWYRHWICYSHTLQGYLAGHGNAIAGYSGGPAPNQNGGFPKLIAYEHSVEFEDPVDGAPLEHDLWYSPEMLQTYFAGLNYVQLGSPGVPFSGLLEVSQYGLGGRWGGQTEQQMWDNLIFHGQGIGPGLSNQYITAQGGSPADGKTHDLGNQSVAHYAWQLWAAVANAPAAGTSRPPRWFPRSARSRRVA
jgi:hypothetical protein